ncbi:MAG: MFS transporter [Chloroflexi bacterium]|nr:MFS transporter [Chloroflexota bacterium]
MRRLGLQSRLEAASQESTGYRWAALGITTISGATNSSLSTAIGPLAPLIQADFEVSRAEIGLITSALFLSAGFSAPFAGRWTDRIGERKVLIVSSLIGGAGALLVTLVGAFWTLLAVCLLIGIGTGMQSPAGTSAIMGWFPPRQRGLAMGVRQTGNPVGGILAASVWAWIAAAQGWRAAYLLGGVMALLAAAVLFVAYYDRSREQDTTHVTPRGYGVLLRDRGIWWLAVVYNCQVIVQFAAATYLVLFLSEELHIPYVVATALFAALNVVALGARIGWGLLSDRGFGARRKPVLVMIAALTLASTVTALLLPRESPLWLAGLLAALFGVSAFAWTAIIGAVTVESAGRESAGTAMALLTVLGTPGQLVGAPLFGLIRDQSGSYTIAWTVLIGVALISVVGALNVPERTALTARPT